MYGTTYMHMIQEGVTQINTDLLQQSNTYLDKPGQIENLSHIIPVDFQFSHQMRLKPIFILQNSLLELLNQDFYSCTNKIEEIIVCKWNQQVCHQQPWTKLVSYCSLFPPMFKMRKAALCYRFHTAEYINLFHISAINYCQGITIPSPRPFISALCSCNLSHKMQ